MKFFSLLTKKWIDLTPFSYKPVNFRMFNFNGELYSANGNTIEKLKIEKNATWVKVRSMPDDGNKPIWLIPYNS